jgi:hypothetical protein
MIDQPFLEDFGTALSADVASAPCQEASYTVTSKVMDPALVFELAHYRIDPGEAGPAVRRTLELGLRFFRVDLVASCYEPITSIDFAR